MTSLDTFEQSYRRGVLDLIYAQWVALGVPFAIASGLDETSVIDPEALLWCSLEFLPAEPRLAEAIGDWLASNEHYLLRQRIIKAAKATDRRSALWHFIDLRKRRSLAINEFTKDQSDLIAQFQVAQRIVGRWLDNHGQSRRLGNVRTGSATILLRARDLLGHDIRHFLLVYLLANPRGGRLRDLRDWSGHAYRSLSDAAERWKAADIITLDSGYCRLVVAEPFRELLQLGASHLQLVNWWAVFEISVRLLRDLANARSKGFEENDAIPTSLKRDAAEKLKNVGVDFDASRDSSLGRLLSTLSAST